MTDAIRELFELLAKKENTGSDYTGTITRVDGNTAYVRFNGSDIDDTPVALSIGASEGDTVRVRVADGRAWLVGNDTAPPNDSSGVAYDLIRTNAYIRQLTTERIYGENGWINLLTATFDFGNGALSWNGERMNVKGAITATSGQIGPWDIGATAIYKGSSTWGASSSGAAYFGDNGISITDKFKVDAAGALTATGATISGTLTSTSGTIGGWNLTGASINTTNDDGDFVSLSNGTNASKDVLIVRTGTAGSYSYPFHLHADGSVTMTNANVTGTITSSSGRIGGWDIGGASLSNTNSSGNLVSISNGTNANQDVMVIAVRGEGGVYTYPFHIHADGRLVAANATITGTVTATSGKISTWTINTSGLTNTTSGRTTNLYPGGIYFGASGVSVNLSETGLGVASSSGSTNILQNTITASNGTTTATMNYLGYALSATSRFDAIRFGHGSGGTTKNVGIWDATINGWIVGHGSDNHITVLPYYTPSDIRIKTDINRSKVKALDVLRQVDIVEFKRYGVYQPIGMISDWMEQLDPQFVGGGGYDEQGNMVIKYIDMFYLQGYLIKAIQELADKVSKLGG